MITVPTLTHHWRLKMKSSTSLFSILLTILTTPVAATPIAIDPGVPMGGYPPATLPLPVYYQFQTSWDSIQWTDEQKNSARDAIDYLGGFFC